MVVVVAVDTIPWVVVMVVRVVLVHHHHTTATTSVTHNVTVLFGRWWLRHTTAVGSPGTTAIKAMTRAVTSSVLRRYVTRIMSGDTARSRRGHHGGLVLLLWRGACGGALRRIAGGRWRGVAVLAVCRWWRGSGVIGGGGGGSPWWWCSGGNRWWCLVWLSMVNRACKTEDCLAFIRPCYCTSDMRHCARTLQTENNFRTELRKMSSFYSINKFSYFRTKHCSILQYLAYTLRFVQHEISDSSAPNQTREVQGTIKYGW